MSSFTIPFLNITYTRRQCIAMAVIFCAYIAAAQLGRYLFVSPAVIQPAAGIALAGLVIGGITLWPAVLAAALFNVLMSAPPLIVGAGGVLAHVLHAVIGAYVLRILGFDPVFRRVRDMFSFLGVALVGSMIVPTLGLSGMYLHNLLLDPDWPIRTTFFSWWAGIMIGDLVLASFIIRSFSKVPFERTAKEVTELLFAFLMLGGLSYALYWTNAPSVTRGILILLYLVPFVWFSLRLGMRFTLLAFLLTSSIALTGVLYGDALSTSALPQRIITTEFFLATLAVIFFLFTAVVEERKRATKQLHAQLNRVHTLLEETKRQDRAKSDFIAVFAHELRNPLAPVVSSTELLKLRFGAHPEIAPHIEMIEDRTKTIVRLLDDLLDVSRISRQTFKLRLELIDMRTAVEKVTSALRPLAEKSGLKIHTALPASAVMVSADAVRVEQMVGNLVMNAIKYTEPGGRIEVGLHVNGAAELRVKDTGIGIPSDMLSRIFVPFAGLGVEQRQKSVKEGIGIGLWLTESLTKEHGGTIVAKSDGPMMGSEFIVRLPLAVPTITTNAIPRMQPVIQNNALRILVVDDNEAAAKGLGTLLQHVGNTVELAFLGSDVAAKATEFKPDVIVLDIGLPDMSGYEVAEQLRTAGFGGKIIALTGYGQDEDKSKAEAAGFDHHLTKPVGIADLQAVLLSPA